MVEIEIPLATILDNLLFCFEFFFCSVWVFFVGFGMFKFAHLERFKIGKYKFNNNNFLVPVFWILWVLFNHFISELVFDLYEPIYYRQSIFGLEIPK